MLEEEILGLNPTGGRRKLVGKQLDEDNIGELLMLFDRPPGLLIPLSHLRRTLTRRGERVWS